MQENYSAQGLIKQFNAQVVCTTDDLVDSLEHHQKINQNPFGVKVVPAFHPDNSMAVENLTQFQIWLAKLQSASHLNN